MNWREYPIPPVVFRPLGIGLEAVGQEWLAVGCDHRTGASFGSPGFLAEARLALFPALVVHLVLNLCFSSSVHCWLIFTMSAAIPAIREHLRIAKPSFLPGERTGANTASKLRLSVAIQAAADSTGRLQTASGNIMVYLDVTADSRQPQAGDVLLLNAKEFRYRYLNPQAFDYRRYLHYQNVHLQAFVEKGLETSAHRPVPGTRPGSCAGSACRY